MRRKHKGVGGVGINDAPYKTVNLPQYKAWANMINHAIASELSICQDWLYFTKFRAWMDEQNTKGKVLTYNLIDFNSTLYSPDTCMFANKGLAMLAHSMSKPGKYPQHIKKTGDKFFAEIMVNGIKKYFRPRLDLEQLVFSVSRYQRFAIYNVAKSEEGRNRKAIENLGDELVARADKYIENLGGEV